MQEIDNSSTTESENLHDEHELFMKDVIQDDHELLYLDSFLSEILKPTTDSE